MHDLGTRWYRFIRWIATNIAFRALGGIKVIGHENIPTSGPTLIAPIHFSYLDPPVVGCAMRRALFFMAKEELFRVPILGPLIRSLSAFPIERNTSDSQAIRYALKVLGEGRAMILFPEGTRGMGEQMGPITAGILLIAKMSKAQVVPVGLIGTEYCLPRNRKWPRRRRITVAFGKPFTFAECENKDAFAERLQHELLQLCAENGLQLKASLPT